MTKPFYILNIKHDTSLECYDEEDLIKNVSKMRGGETASIFKYRYDKKGHVLGMDVQTEFAPKKELMLWAQKERQYAPNREKEERENNYTLCVSYPKEEYLKTDLNDKKHPDFVLEKMFKISPKHSGHTVTIFPQDLRDISFSFGTLKKVREALLGLHDFSFHKKIKVSLNQHFFDNQGFSLNESMNIFCDKKPTQALSFVETQAPKPKSRLFK